MRKYDLAIFDLDGTILETLADLADAVNFALRQEGFSPRSIDEVRWFVGNGIRRLVERAVPEGCPEETAESVYRHFTAYYGAHCRDKTIPYEGIGEMLRALRAAGVQTAVVSNKADFAVQELCRSYFPGLFDVSVGEREGVRRKPCPDTVDEVLRILGVPRERAVYIGDSDVDIETAKNARMACISVDWGFRPRGFLLAHGATEIVSSAAALCGELLG